MYSFEQLMAPVWESGTVVDESVTMVRSNGIAQAPLLFTPEKVLSVTSADKTKEYRQGTDWEIQGNMLRLTENSNAFVFDEQDLIFDTTRPGWSFPTKDGRHSLFSEGHFFHDRQLSVTYIRKEENVDYAPAFAGGDLPRTMEKLQNREDVKIVLYGDSISEGANCSGRAVTTPFLPTWGNLVTEVLKRHYNTKINLINTSLGGMDSRWAVENAQQRVADHRPDLAIIAFGMNDSIEAEEFVANIQAVRQCVLQTSPDTEFILCATTLPNPILRGFYRHQDDFRGALEEMKEKGTIIADFNSMQKFLLNRKRFIDLTGNNVNHPNDFMIRCHAQLLSALLVSKEK